MKALNYQEVTKIVEALNKKLQGARLQRVFGLSNGVVLEFYNQGQTYSLLIQLVSIPVVIMSEKKIKKTKNIVRPIEIFIKSHFLNSICLKLTQPVGTERRLELCFSDERRLLIELSPKAKNLSAYANNKSVHLNKPVKLPDQVFNDYMPSTVRSYEQILQEYNQSIEAKKPTASEKRPQAANKNKIQQDVDKHLSQLKKFEELKQLVDSYKGDWQSKDFDLPESLKPNWDFDSPVYANYEKINERIKALTSKYQRAKDQLNQAPPQADPAHQVPALKKIDVSTRKLVLPSGAVAYIGKTAKDNLLLLRNAKAWFIWMHLKDMPGAHVVVTRGKSQKLNQKELITVGQWLLSQQFQNKKQKMGEKFDIVFTECRYVKPIKGSKAGLVNYQNEKTLTVKFQ